MESIHHIGQRQRLVDEIARKGIINSSVLDAIGKVPRHRFMESGFEQFAYKDQAFPIGAGQTISQPYTVAFQSQCLQVKPLQKVLEIGTGSGYQAAVLLEMGLQVFTIERQRDLYVRTSQLLPQLGYYPRFFYGDGYKGLPTYGPFDGIVVTAGAPYVPEPLKEQMVIGARMVIPVGSGDEQKMMVITRKSETKFEVEENGFFRFVPLLKGTNG